MTRLSAVLLLAVTTCVAPEIARTSPNHTSSFRWPTDRRRSPHRLPSPQHELHARAATGAFDIRLLVRWASRSSSTVGTWLHNALCLVRSRSGSAFLRRRSAEPPPQRQQQQQAPPDAAVPPEGGSSSWWWCLPLLLLGSVCAAAGALLSVGWRLPSSASGERERLAASVQALERALLESEAKIASSTNELV